MVAERFTAAEMARIQVYGRVGNMVAKLKNLSASGAFFELVNGDYVPRGGDFIHMSVHLHSVGRTHEVEAQVVWHEGLGFGVHFIKKAELISKMMSKLENSN